jgi:hypothetical protein
LGKLIVRREDALKILGNSCYPHIADFDRFVLKKAVDEINQHSDIIVEYYRRIERKTILVFLSHFAGIGGSCDFKMGHFTYPDIFYLPLCLV